MPESTFNTSSSSKRPAVSPRKALKQKKAQKAAAKAAVAPAKKATKTSSSSLAAATTTAKNSFKYMDKIVEALKELNERSGSSRQAIQKFIQNKYNLQDEKQLSRNLNLALKRGVKKGLLRQPKGTGANGSFKLGDVKAKKVVVAKKTTTSTKPQEKQTTLKKKATTKSSKKSNKKSTSTAKKSVADNKKSIAAKGRGRKTTSVAAQKVSVKRLPTSSSTN
jgi:histone H1/5